ncbi:Laccase-1 [Leucoagaricus sp. SymC.cos]|nr:Laccase-1 [Leucoagaricus sp. SymC.cos]
MSYFVGGGWRSNAATSVLSQATTTTNNISASRQNSVDESVPGGPGERKPLLRSHTDPLAQLAAQNGSQASLGLTPDPNTGRRFTFRGVARALPYFLRAAPTATTTTVAPQEAERSEVSSPPQSVIDLPSTAPAKRSTLSQEVSPPAENVSDHSGGPVSAEGAQSSESQGQSAVQGRKSRSSSTGSTIVTEEPQAIEEVLFGIKKSTGPIEDYTSLQSRVQELERENEEKASRLRLADEATAKVKLELQRIHATEMESHRREHQQSLDVLQRQSTEMKEKAGGLERELEILRGELATREKVVRERDTQVHNLTSTEEGLQDTNQRLEATVMERDGTIGELRSRNAGLEEERQLLEKYRSEMEAEFLRSKDASEKTLAALTADHEQGMARATNTISSLQNELSNSTNIITQLRTSVDAASHNAGGLSKVAEERKSEVQRLQELVSDLQGTKQSLEQQVDQQMSQRRLAEETAARERAELSKKHALDIDAERRITRNLQSSLESLKLEMDEARKEKANLTTQLNQLRRQLDDTQKISTERNDRIQRLESTKEDLNNSLRQLQAYTNEKDLTIQELQKLKGELEATRENLESRLVDMERTLADARETAQNVLDRTNEKHEHEIMQARTRIQELQDELSSFITTAQQLHASLEASHADTQKAQQIAKERREEIQHLQQRINTFQDAIRSLEVKHDETISQMRSKEQAAREEKASILRHHSAEMQSQRATTQELKASLEHTLREKEESASVINGIHPGPVIAVNKGDEMRVNVVNHLSDPTQFQGLSIHWHGILQKGTNPMDGTVGVTQCPIAPNNSFEYVFKADSPGTYWYHSHFGSQYCDGVRGALVVYDQNDPHKNLYDVDNESTIISLTEWYHMVSPKITGIPSASSTLINGQGRYPGGPKVDLAVVNVEKGKRYRFRVFDMSCEANYMFSIDGHNLTVIEADGDAVSPRTVNTVQLFAGQRYSVVLNANQPVANYWIRSKPNTGGDGLNATFDGGINSAILRYKGAPAADPKTAQPQTNLLLEPDLHPLTNLAAPGNPTPDGADYVFNVTMDFDEDAFLFSMDGVSFTSPTVPVILQLLSGAKTAQDLLPKGGFLSVERNKTVQINFPSGLIGGPHPFHLHGHTFNVVRSADSGKFNFKDPVQRDTLNVGDTSGDYASIRFRTDNPGPWILHCHIDFHLAQGLALVIAEAIDDVLPLNPAPSAAWNQLCPTWDALPDDVKNPPTS